ncbi:MAG TPA: GAF domain-containing sensor histidine kinase [Gemmatimonadaceae bacterium]|nr:GAF domain-containing sensor histidine kinase [Gemmatimonadaceae bacterium]
MPKAFRKAPAGARSPKPVLPTSTTPESLRELMAVREIVHAFLNADRPEEVFQFALDRVSPLVGATFASVYLIDGVSELMHLVAAYNWPERYRPWLGEMRVRLGFGPSGEAAAERRVIEVPDVFADPDLEDWGEVAVELGFKSLVALPLQTSTKVLGAVTFYFAESGRRGSESRGMMRLVADQMSATAEKASLIEQLRRTNAALTEANAELEEQYAAVIEARRAKDEFLANISHELRTPLTSVLGYISILQEELSGPLTEGQRHDLAHVKRASERLLELIEDLLELTTLTRGDISLFVEEFDPALVLREVVSAVQGRSRDVELRVGEPPPFMPRMKSDRKKIARILASLLGNAYKFTAHGHVDVGVTLVGDRVLFQVSDTGIGIPPEAQERVFEEFRQLDGSVTRRYGGSGLGLALARRLARLLGGDVALRSEPGTGTTFTLALPLEFEPAFDTRGNLTIT